MQFLVLWPKIWFSKILSVKLSSTLVIKFLLIFPFYDSHVVTTITSNEQVSSSIEQYRAVSSWYRAVSSSIEQYRAVLSWYREVPSSTKHYRALSSQYRTQLIKSVFYMLYARVFLTTEPSHICRDAIESLEQYWLFGYCPCFISGVFLFCLLLFCKSMSCVVNIHLIDGKKFLTEEDASKMGGRSM